MIDQPVRVTPKEVMEVRKSKDPKLAEIEAFLSEELGDFFVELTPEKQDLFKEMGEKLAEEIKQAADRKRYDLYKIQNNIHKWLRILPKYQWWVRNEVKRVTDKVELFFVKETKENNTIV